MARARFRATRALPVEEEHVVLEPELGVPGHGFPVQAEVLGLGREERDRDAIGELAIAAERLVAVDALPAV